MFQMPFFMKVGLSETALFSSGLFTPDMMSNSICAVSQSHTEIVIFLPQWITDLSLHEGGWHNNTPSIISHNIYFFAATDI